MLSARLSAGSLAAAFTGILASTGDVINFVASLGTSLSNLSTVLEPVFSAASLTGLLLGLLSSRATGSTAPSDSTSAEAPILAAVPPPPANPNRLPARS
jgi:hypothetical protein